MAGILKSSNKRGSAILITVVLTVMLAIVGTLFMLMARVDKTATAARSENEELELAVQSISATISNVLALDVPGMIDEQKTTSEYYDYPGPDDLWLANIEPYRDKKGTLRWHHISDVFGLLQRGKQVSINSPDTNDTNDVYIGDKPIPDYPDACDVQQFKPADADGDGITDSRWVQVPGLTTARGKPIFAAIRIVDNTGMVNVNTAYEFDPNILSGRTSEGGIRSGSGSVADPNNNFWLNGAHFSQVDLAEMIKSVPDTSDEDSIKAFHRARCNGDQSLSGISPMTWSDFDRYMIWSIENPYNQDKNKYYVPFDLADELDLRNRYILDFGGDAYGQTGKSRLENVLPKTLLNTHTCSVPYTTDSTEALNHFDYWPAQIEPNTPHQVNNKPITLDFYDRRHLLTTYNGDRLIDPNGRDMVNVNYSSVPRIFNSLVRGVDWPVNNRRKLAAQLAANVKDFTDANSFVTGFRPSDVNAIDFGGDPNDFNDTRMYFGFEAQPFISEVGIRISAVDPEINNRFAVELYNPFDCNVYLKDYKVSLVKDFNDPNRSVYKQMGFNEDDVLLPKRFFVFYGPTDPPGFMIATARSTNRVDPNCIFANHYEKDYETGLADPNVFHIYLVRNVEVNEVNEFTKTSRIVKHKLFVDRQKLQKEWVLLPEATPMRVTHVERSTSNWHVALNKAHLEYQDTGRLGATNRTAFPGAADLNLNIPDLPLVGLGDMLKVITVGNSEDPNVVGDKLYDALVSGDEGRMRLNMRCPYYSRIFDRLTIWDPAGQRGTNDELDKRRLIQGRININTAPPYVLSKLPWMSKYRLFNSARPLWWDTADQKMVIPELMRAQAIAAYRDRLKEPVDYNQSRYFAITRIVPAMANAWDYHERVGFAGIGELNLVLGEPDSGNFMRYAGQQMQYRMDYYGLLNMNGTELGMPDLTPDSARGDYEKRNLIFSRISNLVTVRSDVFTAYILVRLGSDGPQKRMLAIFDRSGFWPNSGGKSGQGNVKILALHPVPDPR